MLLGVQVSDLTPTLAQRAGLTDMDVDGVLVTQVARFGPASNAGLGPRWVIQRVNGQPVANVEDFDRILRDVVPGDVVSMHAVIAQDGQLAHRIFNIEVPEE
jgi:S1-C subfamily serine protease